MVANNKYMLNIKLTILALLFPFIMFSQVEFDEELSCNPDCEIQLLYKSRQCIEDMPYWLCVYSEGDPVIIPVSESDIDVDNWCDCEEVVDCDDFEIEITGICKSRTIIINPVVPPIRN